MANKKFLLLIVLSAIIFTGLIGAITFQNIFPTTTPYVTSDDTVNLSYGIHAGDGLSSITHSWNGTNYTFIDTSLLGMCNMDNRSELNENASWIHCFSPNGGMNGTVLGVNATVGDIDWYNLSNITWHSNIGKYNGAFNFSGVSCGIDFANNAYNNLTSAGNFTVSAWVYPKSTSVTQGIIAKNDEGTKKVFNSYYTTVFGFSVINNSKTVFTVLDNNHLISVNTWYFYTATFDGNKIYLYVNGDLVNSTSVVGILNQNTSAKINIGRYSNGAWSANGTIDDVGMWNRSLSADEIDYLYKTQVTKYNISYFEYNYTSDVSAYSYSSFLCSKNGTANDFCTSTFNVRGLNTIKSNFSTLSGIIRNDFYGSNTHGYYLSDLSVIDTNSDGTFETYVNSDWYKSAWINAGMTINRIETAFEWSSYENGSFAEVKAITSQTGMQQKREAVEFAYDNGQKVIIVMGYMPNWLANITSGFCNWTVSNSSCPPYNYTRWGELVVDSLDYLTNNGEWNESVIVEVWNEPDLASFYLNNLSTTNINRKIEYSKLWNATYLAVKASYPNVPVIGPSLSNTRHLAGQYMQEWFLSNFSDEMGGYSFHAYYEQAQGNAYDWYSGLINAVFNNCSTYSANCSNIYLDEFNYYNSTVQNTTSYSDEFTKVLGLIQMSALNNLNINNISLINYQFTSSYKYAYSGYPEKPLRFDMLSGPQLDNTYYPPYNVTKNFAHLCPAGGNVWQHEND